MGLHYYFIKILIFEFYQNCLLFLPRRPIKHIIWCSGVVFSSRMLRYSFDDHWLCSISGNNERQRLLR